MDISNDYDAISQCNKCGFCQVACPIFRATGHESGVARGRLALLRALIEGRLDWDKELEGPLYDCLGCGACTANCFPAIPTTDLIIKARTEYLEKVGRKPIHEMLFDHLLPFPRRLHLAARAVAFGMDRDAAIRALTINPAQVLGVADRIGSLEVGKDADLFITTGDPLQITSEVRTMLINGSEVDLKDNFWDAQYERWSARPSPAP